MTASRTPAEVAHARVVGGRFDRRFWTSQGALLVVAVVVGLGALFRQTGVPTFDTVWAEDGKVFAQCGLTGASVFDCAVASYDGWIHVLPRLLAAASYVGWIHVLPRLLAAIATAADPALLSEMLSVLAALAAAACGFLVARAVRDATGSIGAAAIAGTSLTLTQVSAINVGGTLANLHWILIAASCAVLIQVWLGHRFDAFDGTLVGLTVLSSPFGLLLVGLAILGVLLGRPRMRVVAALLTIGVLVQLGAALQGTRIPLPDAASGGLSPIRWFLRYIVNGGVFAPSSAVPNWLVSGALAAIIGWLLVQAVMHGRAIAGGGVRAFLTGKPMVRVMAVAALFGSGLAVLVGSAILNHHVAPRHMYDAVVLIVIALAVGVGLVSRSNVEPKHAARGRPGPKWLRAIVPLTGVLFAVGFDTSFRVQNPASDGPSYRDELTAKRGDCSSARQSITLTTSPLSSPSTQQAGWSIQMPCSRLLQ